MACLQIKAPSGSTDTPLVNPVVLEFIPRFCTRQPTLLYDGEGGMQGLPCDGDSSCSCKVPSACWSPEEVWIPAPASKAEVESIDVSLSPVTMMNGYAVVVSLNPSFLWLLTWDISPNLRLGECLHILNTYAVMLVQRFSYLVETAHAAEKAL